MRARIAILALGSGRGVQLRLMRYAAAELPPVVLAVGPTNAAQIAVALGCEVISIDSDTATHGRLAHTVRNRRAVSELNRLRGEGFACFVEVFSPTRSQMDLIRLACAAGHEVIAG